MTCSICQQSGHNKRTCLRNTKETPKEEERLTTEIIDCPVCDHEDDDETETDDDETVSVVSEDTCECCGRPYDHRNPHRQSEMCDCVQNDDGTLSRPEVSVCEECGVPETDECRPDCAYQARRQKEEEEEHRTRVSPTRDQLVALGKYKLAKFQISKQS